MIAEHKPQGDECEDPRLLNVRALAGCLSVSVRQAHRMNKAGLIPRPLRIGGCVRWRADELSPWLQCGAPSRSVWEQRQAAQAVVDENA